MRTITARTVLTLAALVLAACSGAQGAGPHGGAAQGTRVPARLPSGLRMVGIPGRTSGFRARRALVYLPPAARHARAGERLPVLMLLGGNPSAPVEWDTRWHLSSFADQFAAAHGGRAPIIVMPDENGALTGDTECVDSPRGNAETYLTRDVRGYVLAHYPASRAGAQWAVGGVSEGGMCAALLTLRHPDLFTKFVSMSGLTRPTVAEHDARARTARVLFNGSAGAFAAHDPLALLAHRRYPTVSAWLGSGMHDSQGVAAVRQLAAAARGASIHVTTDLAPGGHRLPVWRAMLPSVFAWLWPRLGQ